MVAMEGSIVHGGMWGWGPKVIQRRGGNLEAQETVVMFQVLAKDSRT